MKTEIREDLYLKTVFSTVLVIEKAVFFNFSCAFVLR